MSIVDSQEPAYREEHEIDVLTALVHAFEANPCAGPPESIYKHIAERDELIRDMARELRSLNDGGVPTDCMEHERRMRELGIEADA